MAMSPINKAAPFRHHPDLRRLDQSTASTEHTGDRAINTTCPSGRVAGDNDWQAVQDDLWLMQIKDDPQAFWHSERHVTL